MIFAVSSSPSAIAAIVTFVAVAGAVVVMVNVAVLLPEATVTVGGTEATDESLLDRSTTNGGSALPSRVIVPVAVVEPVTVVGAMVRVDMMAGSTVRPAVWLVVLYVPVMVVDWLDETDKAAVAVNVAVVAPAATVTEPRTVAAAVLLLSSLTLAPPVGAAAEIVTVPVAVCPW